MSVCETCGALGGAHKTSCTGPVMNELGKPRRRLIVQEPPMHFIRGPIASVLPEVIMSIPQEADITITETTNDGAKALTITASWNEGQ